jgi:hypothetical protein
VGKGGGGKGGGQRRQVDGKKICTITSRKRMLLAYLLQVQCHGTCVNSAAAAECGNFAFESFDFIVHLLLSFNQGSLLYTLVVR